MYQQTQVRLTLNLWADTQTHEEVLALLIRDAIYSSELFPFLEPIMDNNRLIIDSITPESELYSIPIPLETLLTSNLSPTPLPSYTDYNLRLYGSLNLIP